MIPYRFCLFAVLWLWLLMLSGCSFLPRYQAAEGEATATLESLHSYAAEFCVNGKTYSASEVLDNQPFVIPANVRITVINRVNTVAGNMRLRCNSALSFIPEAGQHYMTDVLLSSSRCRTELAKLDSSSRTSVSQVNSMAAGQADCPL